LTSTLPSRRGPDLPYDLVAGVKPCATGWLVAGAKLHGTTFAPEEPRVLDTFIDVLDQRPAFAAIALNAPVGYLDTVRAGGRDCDREARALVGRRGGAIQSAPIHAQFEESANGSSVGMSAVTQKLLPRYREVALEMAPYRQRTVYEVSSEMSFYQLNEEHPLRWSKRSQAGQEERRALLERKIPGGERIYDYRLPRVPYSHMLDVAAFMWTARRIFARAAIRIPQDPQWDERGLRMEILW
jgi:predicted RNase H-like nuclease